MTAVQVAADLSVALEVPGGKVVHGHLSGVRSRLTLEIDDPGALAGSDDAPMVRATAEMLAARGVSVRVVSAGVHLVTVGAVSAPWWQRRATGSRRIKVGSWRGAWTSLRSRAGGQDPVLPDAEALPPPTLFPIAPTFARHPRRAVSTTHNPPGSGGPRLVLQRADMWDGERQPIFWLNEAETTIGSDPGCDVVLAGLEPRHAVVLHDGTDEYVVVSSGPEVRVHGAVVGSRQLLRTGSRVDVGSHTLSFYREEYADHGRPYGGRAGGEIGHQRTQPGRTSSDPR